MARRHPWRGYALGALLVVYPFFDAAAQQDHPLPTHLPTHEFIVAGYGTAGWRTEQDGVNSFFGSLSPLLLFQFSERFLFEAELEFEIEDGATRTGLEYAQIDFFLNDNLTLVAGKFLVPFGVFGERLHPTWINLFATNPPFYGHGGGTLEPLLPIMADFGGMIRGAWSLGAGRSVIVSGFVTQGPFAEADHGEQDEGGHDEAAEGAMEETGGVAPRVGFSFGETTTDLTNDKMVGARAGLVLAPAFEVDVSGLTGAFNEEGSRLSALNLAVEIRRGTFEVRGEVFGMWYDVEVEEPPSQEGVEQHGEAVVASTGGYYLQIARRMGNWQPVLRWAHALDVEAAGLAPTRGYQQLGIGVDYWFSPAIALMAGYEFNGIDRDAPNRLVVHWSFGF